MQFMAWCAVITRGEQKKTFFGFLFLTRKSVFLNVEYPTFHKKKFSSVGYGTFKKIG